jgi:hypothetical protein
MGEISREATACPQAGQVRSELTNINSAGARARSQSSGSIPIPVMRAVPGGAGVPTAGALGIAAPRPVQCCAGPGYLPGEATTCPARCDHKASRPDAATTRLAPPLNDLAPRFAPQRHWTPDGDCSRVRAKEQVREVMVEIFPPDWNCPASVGQRHTGPDLGFCLRVEPRTFSLRRKRSSDRQTKNPPDLRSPFTESNRRPSPYHHHHQPAQKPPYRL